MAIVDTLGLRGPGSVLDEPIVPVSITFEFRGRRDVGGRVIDAQRVKACSEHPDHPADDCTKCKGFEVRRG